MAKWLRRQYLRDMKCIVNDFEGMGLSPDGLNFSEWYFCLSCTCTKNLLGPNGLHGQPMVILKSQEILEWNLQMF